MKKNEKKTKKTIEQELKRDKLILKITSIIIVILLILLLASRNYREFDTVVVSKNNNKIFYFECVTYTSPITYYFIVYDISEEIK